MLLLLLDILRGRKVWEAEEGEKAERTGLCAFGGQIDRHGSDWVIGGR